MTEGMRPHFNHGWAQLLVICLAAAGTYWLSSTVRPAQPAGAAAADTMTIPPDVRTYKDIVYATPTASLSGAQVPLHLDLFVPALPAGASFPVVVYIHGGGWHKSDRAERATWPALLRHGLAVASIDYRLTDQAPFPAQIHDCKGAIRFLRAHAAKYHLDGAHIGAWGPSAGGHLAALLGTSAGDRELEGDVGGNLTESSLIQAACDWYGPIDILTCVNGDWDHVLFKPLFGGPVNEHLDLVEKASPNLHISPRCPPFLIMHGDSDGKVAIEQSTLLETALQQAGVAARMVVVPGGGHGGAAWEKPETMKPVIRFFTRYLPAAPAESVPGSL
jgi:acetyl esterase/lipase